MIPLPEHLQDRYEELRAARAESNEVKEPIDLDELTASERPEYCFEDVCTYPECDCWMQEDGSDD